MRTCLSLATFVLCATAVGTAQQREAILPAGTLLQCTVDEPNFSSGTAERGDPVLCHVSSLSMFGRSVFPRGAYLSGGLEDYREPGHFFGKGWLEFEFTSLTLPGEVFPLSAKVVSAAPYRVDREGKIRGRGHPRRDAVKWAIPVFWPAKVITLPARGPRPAFRGETRIALRLLEDMEVPQAEPRASSTSRPSTESSRFRSNIGGGTRRY